MTARSAVVWIFLVCCLALVACSDTVPPDPRLAQETLSRLLRDPDPLVRRPVAESLGKIGDPGAAPLLEAALHDTDASVREAAARALGQLPTVEPSVGEALIGLLQDPEAKVRRAAAQALGRAGWPPVTVDRLAQLLRDANAQVRLAAAQALLSAEAPASRAVIDALVQAAQDPDATVRQWALAALAEAAGERAVPVLTDRLMHDQAEGVRVEAAYRLSFVGDRSAAETLDTVSRRALPPDLQRWVVQSRTALTRGSGSD